MGRLRDWFFSEMPWISAKHAGIETTGNGAKNSRLLEELIQDAHDQRKPLLLDFGRAEFADRVRIENIEGVTVTGAGSATSTHFGGTVLEWVGDAIIGPMEPSTFLHFVNCRDCTFQDFSIITTYPLGVAIRSSTLDNGHLPPSRLWLERIRLDGINGSLNRGVVTDSLDGSNRNNDICRFTKVLATNLGTAPAHGEIYDGFAPGGFEFQETMSMLHVLDQCSAKVSGYRQRFGIGSFGVSGGSYRVTGGNFGGLDTVFKQNLTVAPITIDYADCEGNRALFNSHSQNRFAGEPISIRDVRYQLNKNEDGDVLVRCLNSGPLTLSGLSVGGQMGKAVTMLEFGPKRYINPAAGTTMASCTVRNCIMRSSLPPDELILFPNSVANIGKVEGYEPAADVFGCKNYTLDEHGKPHWAEITA